jgi:hypothetical protein
MLKGKQKKLDKNKDGKISGEDFAIIRQGAKNGGRMKCAQIKGWGKARKR